jgi:hypothetical protein
LLILEREPTPSEGRLDAHTPCSDVGVDRVADGNLRLGRLP